jgi:hypothetical protein
MGGEACQIAGDEHRASCDNALAEMARFHWSYINAVFYLPVLEQWKDDGCYAEIIRRLGYRLRLDEAELPPEARPGGHFDLRFFVHNEGWAGLFNPRPLLIVVDDGSHRYEVELTDVDPRDWLPGTTAEVAVRLELPANIPEGDYRIAIWLPDAAAALRSRPEYAVRLANQEVWRAADGTNVLGSMRVDDHAPGTRNPRAGAELRILPPR